MTLDDFRLEVSCLLNGIGLDSCLRVLYHDHSVLVIDVGDGERIRWEIVEKLFLCFYVIFECLVIIQVITSDIGEQAANKVQSSDSVLNNRVRTDFHEHIFTASISHLG